ncbi:hypothetical protein ACVP6W_003123 [Vibrio cholerae]
MSVEIISTGNDTTLMQRPCVTLKVQGKLIKDVTEIKLQESTVAQPSIIFQIGGGLNHDQIHFYHFGVKPPHLWGGCKALLRSSKN